MLNPAIVTNYQCAFVEAVLDYFECLTYSLNCCVDDAYELYLSSKIVAQIECSLSPEEICTYTLNAPDSSLVDCTIPFVPKPCDEQVEIDVSVSSLFKQLYVHMFNRQNGSAHPYFTIADNQIEHPSQIIFFLTDSPTYVVGPPGVTTLAAGSTLYDTNYLNTGVNRWYIPIRTTNTHPASYIRTIRLGYTEFNGTYTGAFVDADVSPASSPYLNCIGCTVVNPAHLYFGSANWSTAMVTVLRNIAFSLTGDANRIEPECTKNNNGHYVGTFAKRNPSQQFFGLDILLPSFFTYHDGASGFEYTQYVGDNLTPPQGRSSVFAQTSFDLTGPFGDVTVTAPNEAFFHNVANGPVAPISDRNYNGYVMLPPTYSLNPLTYTAANNLSGTFYTINVTIDKPGTISLVYDDTEVAYSDNGTLTYTTTNQVAYDLFVTLPNGCEITQTIEL
jgi:hypothetical protein